MFAWNIFLWFSSDHENLITQTFPPFYVNYYTPFDCDKSMNTVTIVQKWSITSKI